MKRGTVILVAMVALALPTGLYLWAEPLWRPAFTAMTGGRTVDDVVKATEDRVRVRRPAFAAYARYREFALVVIKQERTLSVLGHDGDRWQRLHVYRLTAFSGDLGPKLREGDRQIPEGVYRIVGLNPNSSYHLSLKVDYPNVFDRRMARADGRRDLGGNIFIHGDAVTIGCIPIGDAAIEELFYLVARAGPAAFRVVISPVDFCQEVEVGIHRVPWQAELYREIRRELDQLQVDAG